MTKSIVSLILSASLILAAAMSGQDAPAANLNEYRAGLLKSAGTGETESLARLAELRRSLVTEELRIEGLEAVSIPDESHHRFYSSITLKDIMQNGVTEVMRSQAMDAPMAFDPSWTPDEQRAVKALSERKRCVRSLMNSRKLNGKADGLNLLVNEIYSKLAIPEATVRKAQASRVVSPATREAVSKMRQTLMAHLADAPENSKDQLLGEILGPIGEIDFTDGMVHRVFFGQGAASIPASLSMLLTYRLGEDGIFVQTQDCLLQYLKDQQEVLTERQSQMNSWVSFELIKRGFEVMKNWLNEVERVRPSILQAADDKARAQQEIDEMYEMIQTEDGTAQYLAKLKFFSEGRDFAKDAALEKAFIDERLQQSKFVIPYLEEKARIARVTNTTFRQLSRAQANFLLDMFLQLRGRDLPTVQDMIVMGESFAREAMRVRDGKEDKALTPEQNSRLQQMGADFMYYRVIGNQLTELQSQLASAGDIRAAREHELELLRKR